MMDFKKAFAIAICFCIVATAYAKTPTYSLTYAVKKKLVQIEIKGADGESGSSSGHYGKCIQMDIKNISLKRFKIKLEAGQQFFPGDTSIQNMMVTEGEIFTLGPKKSLKEYINAMCVQKNDGGPNPSISFTVGTMSEGHLMGIAKLVEKHRYFNSTAQNAVWCISDGADISTINGSDSTMVSTLQKFVSEATGQPIPKREAYFRPTPRPQRHSTNTITFEWKTHKPHPFTLVVLNMNNRPVKEVFKDKILQAGSHSYEIILSTATLPKGYYKVILYMNNKIAMHRKVRLGR